MLSTLLYPNGGDSTRHAEILTSSFAVTHVPRLISPSGFPVGIWSLIVTEWAPHILAYILTKVYNQYRLWFFQPRLRAVICNLDISIHFGGGANTDEVLQLLVLIESIGWSEVPLKQCDRLDVIGGGTGGSGLGRNTALAEDFIYFTQWVSVYPL